MGTLFLQLMSFRVMRIGFSYFQIFFLLQKETFLKIRGSSGPSIYEYLEFKSLWLELNGESRACSFGLCGIQKWKEVRHDGIRL